MLEHRTVLSRRKVHTKTLLNFYFLSFIMNWGDLSRQPSERIGVFIKREPTPLGKRKSRGGMYRKNAMIVSRVGWIVQRPSGRG